MKVSSAYILVGLLAIAGCEKSEEEQAKFKSFVPFKDSVSEIEPSKDFKDASAGYFRGYVLLQKAAKAEDQRDALVFYKQAYADFSGVKEKYPEWKTGMVENRIEMTREEIEKLSY